MQILEMTFTVDKRGGMKIPPPVLAKMGLAAGSHVRVAYLTHDGTTNTFCELMLLPNEADGASPDEDGSIRIPLELRPISPRMPTCRSPVSMAAL